METRQDFYQPDIKIKKKHVVNVVQAFNAGGIQKLLLEYLRYFKNHPSIYYTVLVLEKNRNSAFDLIAEEEGLDVVYLNCEMSENKHYFIRTIWNYLDYNGKLFLWLQKNKPDIIHTHNTRIFIRIQGCIKALVNKYKWYHTLHSDPTAVCEKHLPIAQKVFKQLGVKPICLNNTQFEKARERYGIKECDILYNIFDIREFQKTNYDRKSVRIQFHIPQDAYVVGAVGRLDLVKNYSFLVDAFAEVVKKNSRAVLVFVGDGSERENLRRQTRELGIEENVYFLGTQTELYKIYDMMDVFVSTSLTEAAPFVVLEAQTVGTKCVVASSIPVESVFTKNVVRMSGDATLDEWVQEILCPKNFSTPVSNLEDYSIEKNAMKLVDIYFGE